MKFLYRHISSKIFVIAYAYTCLFAIDVTIPNLEGYSPGDTANIPVSASELSVGDIVSFYARITYDHNIIEINHVNFEDNLTQEWSEPSINNSSPGLLVIGAFGTQALLGAGILFDMTADVIGSGGQSTAIQLVEFYFKI